MHNEFLQKSATASLLLQLRVGIGTFTVFRKWCGGVFGIGNSAPGTRKKPIKGILGQTLLREKENDRGDGDIIEFSFPAITAVIEIEVEEVPSADPHKQEGHEVEHTGPKVSESSSPIPSRRHTTLPLLGHLRREVVFGHPHNANKLQGSTQTEIHYVSFNKERSGPRPSPIG
jgi:hypothetical protein